ncbi:SsgA family sporulation/cell division regulator [Kitasatospora terrestris]|uniref:SsgA family sporulation/cell division regulator n=1 Tax=Kitasatospora terrestris TaxID=258051 RepID=A0ABP9DQF9_9ACTN
MPGTPAVVEQLVHARLLITTHRSARLRVTLRYRADDPLAVHMLFPAEYALDADRADRTEEAEPAPGGLAPARPPAPPEIEWVFARQLLTAGLELPSGLGDVHIRPALGRRTMVELRSPEGTALLQFDSNELRRFLWRSHVAVPEGSEPAHLDADRALAQLLG